MPTISIDQLRSSAENGDPNAQFQLSQFCLQNRDLNGMIHWLERASDTGFPFALDALGHCYEKGMGVTKDCNAALQHYDRADQGGSALAAYRRAELLYKSRKGVDSKALICELLQRAANADLVLALRVIGYLALQQQSCKELAVECLRRAASAGDPASGFNLAWSLLQDGADTQPEAVYWLQQAKDAQYPCAEALLTQLQGVNAARPPACTTSPVELDDSFSLYPQSQHTEREDLCADPAVSLFKNVLDIVDCAHLIFLSRPSLQRADVIDPHGQGAGMSSDVRTSLSTFLPFDRVDFIGRYAELKIIAATGETLESSEPMSILCYAPGQYYRPHFDFFNPRLPVSQKLLQNGGQRTASAITYLATPLAGGATSFPRLSLEVPASAGNTLWFKNCSADGQVDERSLHAGDPVEQGEKWIVTKWFRETRTQYLEF